MNEFKTFEQESAYVSPWSRREKVGRLAWGVTWALLCMWTPQWLNPWRLFWLRRFGAKIEGRPFIHPQARIQIPWNLTLGDRCVLGDRANAYSLGEIELGAGCQIAREAYLCTGTHEFSHPALRLQVARITIGPRVVIHPRAFIMPGVVVGEGAVIAACAVVTRDVAASATVAGNPAREVVRQEGR